MSSPSQTLSDARETAESPDPKPGEPAQPESAAQDKRDANAMMMTGVGIGVLGAVTAVIGGAVCPVCVVATPALLGVGAFRRWRASRKVSGAQARGDRGGGAG